MATFEKRGSRWRVRIRRGDTDLSESFRTKAEAQAWALQHEADVQAGRLGRAPDKSFGDLLQRYIDEVTVDKDGKRWEELRLRSLLGGALKNGTKRVPDPLTLIRLDELAPRHFADWRDRRLKVVKTSTVLREWNLLSAICTRACSPEWRWLFENPLSQVQRPQAPAARTRRITADETEQILVACGYSRSEVPRLASARVGAAFLWGIETAMRAGEICALRWSDINMATRVARVRAEDIGARKTGAARMVPLSREALRLLKQLEGIDETSVFALRSASVDSLFRKARDCTLVADLHFHDTRAEALTRMSKKLDVMQLARVSGHKDIKLLFNVYYRETAEDMAKLLD